MDPLKGGIAFVFIATVTWSLWLLRRAAVVWGNDAAAGAALGVFVFMQRLSEAAYCRLGKTRISLVDIYMDMHCFHIDRDGMGTDDAHV